MYKEILTAPQNHNPNNFIYIVHAIHGGYSNTNASRLPIRNRMNNVRTEGRFYSGSLIGKLDPETARKIFNKYRSNSPISQTSTNGTLGFILGIPDDSVIRIAATHDLNSPKKQKELRGYVDQHKDMKKPPLILLVMNGDDSLLYNEMVLAGHPQTTISGVFYQDQDSRTETRGKLLGERVSQLEGKKIPIIALPQSADEGLIVMMDGSGKSPKDLFEKLFRSS